MGYKILPLISAMVMAFTFSACGAENKDKEGEMMKNNDFIQVEGGSFMMGSAKGEANESPEHRVAVSTFWMSRYQVSQAEWKAIMGRNPSWISGDNLPVEQVTWYKAVEYCNKRSLAEGFTPCYSGSGDEITCNWNANGYRLPTEAEWEFAAQGGKDGAKTLYSGGNTADAVAWHKGNARNTTHPAGGKAPNALGLYDLSGNIYEWCYDRYGAYGSAPEVDPRGAESGIRRVLRGGSWAFDENCSRITFRRVVDPGYIGCSGLRLVRNSINKSR